MSTSSGSPASTSPSSTPTTVTEVLTTLYTPPAACKSRLYTYETESSGTLIVSHSVAAESSCYPPNYSGQSGHIAYSPGVCPSGWRVLHSTTSDGVFSSTCCPESMVAIDGYQCASWIIPPATIAIDASRNTTITAPALAFEWYISVEWASSDLNRFTPRSAPLLTTTSISASSTTSPSAPSRPTGVASSTAPASSHHNSSGGGSLAIGAIAGIAVGAVVGFLLIITAIICCVLSSRKRKYRNKVEIKVYASGAGSSNAHGNYPPDQHSSYANGSSHPPMTQPSPMTQDSRPPEYSYRPTSDRSSRQWI